MKWAIRTPNPYVLATQLLCLAQLAGAVPQDQLGVARTSERFLRSWATVVIAPTYPEEAIRAGTTGVAVAEVRLNEKSVVEAIDVLQAPSAAVTTAVRTAIKLWRFVRPEGSRAGTVSAKLTFYFVRIGGRYRVLSPAEAPNLAQALYGSASGPSLSRK
jgi:TonB family protein